MWSPQKAIQISKKVRSLGFGSVTVSVHVHPQECLQVGLVSFLLAAKLSQDLFQDRLRICDSTRKAQAAQSLVSFIPWRTSSCGN